MVTGKADDIVVVYFGNFLKIARHAGRATIIGCFLLEVFQRNSLLCGIWSSVVFYKQQSFRIDSVSDSGPFDGGGVFRTIVVGLSS